MSDPADLLRLEPDDLDGHTIDELRLPRSRLRARRPLHRRLARLPDRARGPAAAPRPRRRVPRGRRPAEPAPGGTGSARCSPRSRSTPGPGALPDPRRGPARRRHVTEGAIRGLVRSVGDDVPGLLVGAVRLGSGDPVALRRRRARPRRGAGGRRRPVPARAPTRAARPRALPGRPIDIAVIGLIPAGSGQEATGDRRQRSSGGGADGPVRCARRRPRHLPGARRDDRRPLAADG